jgi:hypothetical protein
LEKGRIQVKRYEFLYNKRLGIELPVFHTPWEDLETEEQQKLLYKWEQVRAQIPDQVKYFEALIKERELKLQIEDDNETFCRLSMEIADYASRVIDLNLWFRTQEEVTSLEKVHS